MFGCPVIEAYGMTEAAHQMTSNPLGGQGQKAGFVGIATSPEVCVMDQEGNRLDGEAEGGSASAATMSRQDTRTTRRQ